MFFLVPVIIVKASMLLDLAKEVFSQEQLDAFCSKVDRVETMGLEQEIYSTLRTWVRVHSALVLLQSALDPPEDHVVHVDPATLQETKKHGYLIAAYSEEEVGQDGASGQLGEAVSAIGNVNVGGLGGLNLASKAIQEVGPDATVGLGQKQPLLRPFLQKFQEHGLSLDFDPVTCLEACRQSVVSDGFHNEAPFYTTKALNLLRLVWGPSLRHDLAEVSQWLVETPNPIADTTEWLNGKLQLDSLSTRISDTDVFNSNNDEAKLALNRIAALLDHNGSSLLSAYRRLADDRDGMKAQVESFKGKVPQQERAWNDLLAATYGAIAWQIFQQVRLAVWEAWGVLERV
jgi:hypothetical protein